MSWIGRSLVSNELSGSIIDSYQLSQNYPNPFNPNTSISFQLSRATSISLKVYSLIGKEVTTLVEGRMNAGNHTVSFDASGLASGVYVYRLSTESYTNSKKMVLLK